MALAGITRTAWPFGVRSRLGPVDGSDHNESGGESDEGCEVCCGFLAAERDPLEALELADRVLDPGTAGVKKLGEEGRLFACV
jgi:hypothetical protein